MKELIGKIGLIKNALREHANKNLYKLFVVIIKKTSLLRKTFSNLKNVNHLSYKYTFQIF